MKLTLTQPAGGHAAGDTINVTPGAAKHLQAVGAAKPAEKPQKGTSSAKEKVVSAAPKANPGG